MQPDQRDDVLIIGAGLSGLACAQALAKRGISARILETHKKVAQSWRDRHPQLRLNIHRKFVPLPGLKLSDNDGTFLRRDTVIKYLEDYAANIDVPIEFEAKVMSIERSSKGWTVGTSKGQYRTTNIIVATGRDRIAKIPDWHGLDTLKIPMIHARDVGDIKRFDGQQVLVIGAGNSGTDILNHLSHHRPSEVLVSVRHGPAIVPARIFGFPLHRLARLFAAMPTGLADHAFRLTQRLFLGKLPAYGLSSHPDGGGTRLMRDGVAFAIDDGFVAALKSGWFRTVAAVKSFEGDAVVLADGSILRPDVVIAATGYRTGLEKLLWDLDAVAPDGRPYHPSGELDYHNPGLWFAGYRAGYAGYFDGASKCAEKIARAIALDLPRLTAWSYDQGEVNRVSQPTK